MMWLTTQLAPSTSCPRPCSQQRHGGGFTLIEALTASVILLLTVMATSIALSSSHQHAQEFQDRVQASLAAEGLMAQILANPYSSLGGYNGHNESPGTMVTPDGTPYPDIYAPIGRRATVTEKDYAFPDLGVRVRGREVIVDAYDEHGRILVSLVRFVPEPGA